MAKSQARENVRIGREAPYCHPKTRLSLPFDQIEAAVRTAVEVNPANESPLVKLGAARGLIRPTIQRIAITTSNYWGPQGVDLPVYFMDGGKAAYKNKVLQMFNNWGGDQGGNVVFKETLSPTGREVRVARTRGQGYYSYLGPDIFHIPLSECTMNLDSFSESTPDSEYLRVVQHECGHTLGCPHDQLRKAILDLLDPEKVIAVFMASQGWSRQEVIDQILTPLPESDLLPISGPADQLSIMTYQFPGSVTKSGQPIPGGLDINKSDFALIARAYPKKSGPTPPTPSGTWSPYSPKANETVTCTGKVGLRTSRVTVKLTDLKAQLEANKLDICRQS